MANVLGSMVIQDLTFTQVQHGTDFTITYLNGGIAGQETVTYAGTDIYIKIASGTSTATQIKAAFDADHEATSIATCTISGTGSNAQKSAVQAYLSGGANATKAAAPLAFAMRLEARTAGTAGNSIQYVFADTGTLSVVVVGNDITINVDDTVTSWEDVESALRASAPASTLVGVFSPNDMSQFTVDIVAQNLPLVLTPLAGGTAATAPAVAIQDLTYTSTTSGPTSLRQSITYTHGATAGSEVVTLDANGSETIQIENGVSTATQVKAAHDASAPALALRTVAITGTGTNAQYTVNMEDAITSEATPSTKDYFSDQTIIPLTADFVAQPFGFHARTVVLSNDETAGTDVVEWSFDGTNKGGELEPGESITLDKLGNGTAVISLRSAAVADYHLNVIGV